MYSYVLMSSNVLNQRIDTTVYIISFTQILSTSVIIQFSIWLLYCFFTGHVVYENTRNFDLNIDLLGNNSRFPSGLGRYATICSFFQNSNLLEKTKCLRKWVNLNTNWKTLNPRKYRIKGRRRLDAPYGIDEPPNQNILYEGAGTESDA